MRIRTKLLIVWVATLLLLVGGIMWPLQWTLRSSFERVASVGFTGSVQSLASLRSERVDRMRQAGALVMNIPELRALIAEHSYELTEENLASLQERLDALHRLLEVSFICVIDGRGTLIAQNHGSPWPTMGELGQFTRESPQAQAMMRLLFETSGDVSDVSRGREGLWVHRGHIYQVVGVPLSFGGEAGRGDSQGTVEGALIMAAPLADDMATSLGRSHDCKISFLADGKVLSSSLSASERAELAATYAGKRATWPVSAPFTLGLGGQNYQSWQEPLSDPCSGGRIGAMLVQNSAAHAEAVQRKVRESLALITLAGLLAALAISYLLSGAVTRPVRGLVEGARRVAGGDLETALPVKRHDELGELAVAFNDMVKGLRRRRELQAEVDASRIASQAKSDFLANMSHEIRTPLNGVTGMLELLQGTGLNDQQRRYAQIARASADALLTLINDILDFSKIEAGKLELDRVDFDATVKVEEVVEMLAPLAGKKGLELVGDVKPGQCTAVRGDPDRFRQVVINLATNAIKFTERGEVVVRLSVEQETDTHAVLRCSVTDSGIGIPRERMDRLFKTFSQVDASTTRKYGGTGLGLAICKQLVELMGGTIGVESEYGKGSTFWFTVKLERQPAREAPQPPVDIRGMRVAVVDDSAMHCDILRAQLGAWGLECETFPSGAHALEAMLASAAAGQPFRLAILDWAMPGMNGLELARTIRAMPAIAETALIMLTSFEASVKPEELKAVGFNGLLTKPLRQSRLLDSIMESAVKGRPGTWESGVATVETGHAAAPSVGRRRARVLLAEDNEVNQMVAAELLAKAGYSCHVVGDGRQAVQKAMTGEFDVVLMDCQMPEMDGFEATRAIRQRERESGRPGIKVIALTANAIKGDRERCLDAGMDEYLIKPLDPRKLIQTIESCTPGDSDGGGHWETDGGAETAVRGAEMSSPVDYDTLLQRCMGDAAFVGRVLEKFQEQAVEQLNTVVERAKAKDAGGLTRSAHKLTGLAANLSAEALRGASSRIEAMGRSGEIGEVETAIASLQEEVQKCLEAIPALIRRSQGSQSSK